MRTEIHGLSLDCLQRLRVVQCRFPLPRLALSDQSCRRLVVLGIVDPRYPKLGQPRPQPNRIRVPSID
ncbi:Uncharacterised protein [Vibrio cholerae]|nr:Uncharacterised protein [Vibrio cholerae]